MFVRTAVGLAVILAATSTVHQPDVPKPRAIGIVAASVQGDTVLFTARSQRHPQATGIEWCVRPWLFSLTGWTGLPCTLISPADTIRVIASSTSWDSVRFRVVAWSRRNAERSRDSVYVITPTFKRPLPPPGPIVIDTSLTVAAVLVRPGNVEINIALQPGRTVQFCAYLSYLDGKVALPIGQRPQCDEDYLAGFSAAQRTPSAAQQAKTDGSCVRWLATGGTITAEACGTLGAELRARGSRAL
jgi:hypothetical protein